MCENTQKRIKIEYPFYLCLMRFVANALSYIFHPLIVGFLLVSIAYGLDRYSYFINGSRAVGAVFIMNFALLVLLPLIGVAMLVGLKMISSYKMPKREERIGPLIITLSFYIWYFININNNQAFPETLRFVALGATLSVGFAFFINNFSKISLHTVGCGSFLIATVLLIFHTKTSFIDIDLGSIGSYRLSTIFVLLLSTLIAGAVGSSRLYLKVHRPQEIYGGYLVGILAQIIAFRIFMN